MVSNSIMYTIDESDNIICINSNFSNLGNIHGETENL